jgi:hypothetical protein
MANKLKEQSLSSKDWWKALKTFISSTTFLRIISSVLNKTSIV